MNARIVPLAAVLVALPLVLAGCGNKGPLILPPKQIPVDPSSIPSSDNPNIAMPPAESSDDADAGTDTDTDSEPSNDTPAPPATTPTDDPARSDDDGGRG